MLPIEAILPDLKRALNDRTAAVLIAPPGAGKTTRVPLALLDEPWLSGRRILMLEPRRLAARAAAHFMAAARGEQVGATVGYRVRLESRVGPSTRVEVITEGILTRMLQSDPALDGVGLVIFDEFHERSLHADLGLALSLQSQSVLRGDLRLLVMSATLQAEPVATLLGDAPVLISEGRVFPVETRYLGAGAGRSGPGGAATGWSLRTAAGSGRAGPAGNGSGGILEQAVLRAVRSALAEAEGDLLVFLPGAAEIRRAAELLSQAELGPGVVIAPLHGSLRLEEQDRAIAPAPPGCRKVVLATSIAETSLTIEGVRVVIDTGLMRVPRFSPRTGLTRLETIPVTRAAADQRRGRAGRLAPGLCLRLWTEEEDRHLLAGAAPEILEADLAPLALELAAWGVSDPAVLAWLDPPPAGALAQARVLLRSLGAIGPDGAITGHGRHMAESGLHPRLAHMVLQAQVHGYGDLGCELAALLGERDLLLGPAGRDDADLRLRVELLRGRAGSSDAGYARRVQLEARALRREFGVRQGAPTSPDLAGVLLAFAYPDRIAQRREGGGFLLSSGRGAALTRPQPLSEVPYLVAAELDDQGAEGRIHLAAPLEQSDLAPYCTGLISSESVVTWDRSAQAVRARRRRRLGAIVLEETNWQDPPADEVLAGLLQGVAEEGLGILPWTRTARQLQQRVGFLRSWDPTWPDLSDTALASTLAVWLGPHLWGYRSRSDLQGLPLADTLLGLLSRDQRRQLDEDAPTHWVVPSGSRIAIDYSDPGAPVLAVRLQEMFGLAQTPRIGRGRVPLMLHLLSPANRPVQVTRDLGSFWSSGYFEVRKDLRGRYPKHYWPENPLLAVPTNRAKPRNP